MTFLIGIVAAGLSMMSAFAWVGSSPIVASCLAVESAFMLICSGVFSIGLRRTLRDRRTFKPSAHLLLEAETEQALDDAIREVNAQAEAWNKAAKVAQRYTLSDGLAAAIHDRRRFISGRIDEFRIRLRRHRLSAAPMPQELVPPHDWGVSEPFDLARHPGS